MDGRQHGSTSDRDRGRDRSRSRERGRDYGIDRRRDDRAGDSRPAGSSHGEAAGPAKSSVRRYFRKGPSGWDVKLEGWTEGMAPPTTLAPPPGGASAAPTQQTRHARRIYVGGLEAVPEQEIAELFTAIIRATMITPLPADASPVLSVYINPERKFAFVEVATIELATALMALDGMTYKGQPLKIRRPHDYKPEILPPEIREKAEPLNLQALGLVGLGGGAAGSGATGVGTTGNRDSLHRIFVGGLPNAVEEQQLAELMGAFGAIKHLHIVRGPDGSHKGYGFCEYLDPNVTDLAVQSLNGLQIGDRSITVSRAKGGQPGGGGAGATGANTMPLGPGGLDPAAMGLAGYGGPMDGSAGSSAAAAPMRQPPIGVPTTVVCLENMVQQGELADDKDYGEICEDISEEAGKYGQVNLAVPRPPAPGAGRVFLQYQSLEAAIAAANAMAGRKFGDNFIVARYYDEAAFAAGNLTA